MMDIITRQAKIETVTLDRGGQVVEKNPLETTEYVVMLSGNVEMPMMKIPAGVFDMGSLPKRGEPEEMPRHNVLIKSFYLGKYPVTQGQWNALMKQSQPFRKSGDDRPANRISWNTAQEFCKKLTEYGGTPFYFGDTITTDFVNFVGLHNFADEPKGVYRGGPTGKDEFPPNRFGLHDMHGNVWEWCEDAWHDDYAGAPLDGKPWSGGDPDWRVMRGGCWHDPPSLCRSTSRLKAKAEEGEDYFGFRVAATSV
jgi:formylglycine-generating enzyme required for sulfatase activity